MVLIGPQGILKKKTYQLERPTSTLGANFVIKYYYFDEIHIIGSK
jgi:hypothetical protein